MVMHKRRFSDGMRFRQNKNHGSKQTQSHLSFADRRGADIGTLRFSRDSAWGRAGEQFPSPAVDIKLGLCPKLTTRT